MGRFCQIDGLTFGDVSTNFGGLMGGKSQKCRTSSENDLGVFIITLATSVLYWACFRRLF